MFETSVIRENTIPAERRAGLVTLSIALHSSIALAAIVVALTNLRFPQQAPNQFALFQQTPLLELPQPKGTPDGGGARPHVTAVRPMPPQPLAPATETIAPQPVSDAAPTDARSTDIAAGAAADSLGAGGGTKPGDRGTPGGIDGAVATDGPATPLPANAWVDVTPLPVGGDVQAPVILSRVVPVYPEALRRGRMAGNVVLQCVIDRQGHIRDAHVVRSSFGGFDQAALDAVRRWHFLPGSLHGKPVETYFDLTIRFDVR
jgi:protein TonB